MKKILLSIVAIATIAQSSFGQAPEGFKYQAVVRDAGNTILTNQAVGMQLTIQQGSIGGSTVYQETFAPTTNAYGLVNLEIGSGTVVSGDFTTIDWANGPYFIETAVDVTGGTSYAVMGTSQLMSVPYALHANTAENVTNDMVDDADADPNNEIQTLSFTNDTLYLSSGGFIDLASYSEDLVDDADADPTNELQDLQLIGNVLTITNNGTATSIDLSGYLDNTDTQLDETAVDAFVSNNGYITSPDDADADPNNEIQTLSFTNDTLYLSSGGFIDLASYSEDLVDDADADATNELQNIEQVLVVGNDANGNNIVNTGQIGIGTATPNAESSMEIATALPVVFPSMTQAEVDAIVTPVEGMVQFNTDAHKLQVYAELIDNADILNEIYIGNESGPFGNVVDQSFTAPIDGQVIAVELMLKDDDFVYEPNIDFIGQGIYTVPSYSQFTWHTFILTSPIPVTAGGVANFIFIGPGVDFRSFATNSNYPNGSLACCLPTADDDVLFRVHIQPNPGSFGWQNMH
jgi:hypothetical protein